MGGAMTNPQEPGRVPESGQAQGHQEWTGRRVCVAGIRVAGAACARVLLDLGADVIAVDGGTSADHELWAEQLRAAGAQVRLGAGDVLPEDVDLLVVSPGFPPHAPIIRAAQERGVEVWGELELAWRMRGDGAAPWLAVTGTNGKTTTTLMLDSILRAAGQRSVAAGNIGVPLVETVMRDDVDVIAVEVGAAQLPFWHTVSPLAAVCLNVAEDHMDVFEDSMDAYVAAKSRIYQRCEKAAVFNVAEPMTLAMVEEAEVQPGCRAIGYSLGTPALSELGVVEDLLVDRAFIEARQTNAEELATFADVHPFAPHNVGNALAAAALARAYGVPVSAVAQGLRSFEPAGHRIATVATVAGVAYIDDSKATNSHAALTSLLAHDPVVWIAGGLAKGQNFDDLVAQVATRLRGVVLLGRDRKLIAAALARHAAAVPVIDVAATDTGAMAEAVVAAASLARSGDTVLLAPGCASWDMFTDYAQRGDRFAEEVRRIAAGHQED
jgi:UDP-N-acetylmuramoylalanine--D-glutamate ligase